MSKKNALLITLVGTLLFSASMYPVGLGLCDRGDYDCRIISEVMQLTTGIFPAVFLLSLITYRMREEVFRAWWGVAKWFVPVIIAATFLFNMPGTSGLGMSGAYADTFSVLILGLLYTIFIITSIIKIILAYRRLH